MGRAAYLAAALGPVVLATRGLALDQPVPDFKAADLNGAVRTLADYRGKATLVLFWHPSNARSRAALCAVSSLAAEYQPAGLVTVVSGVSGREEIQQAAEACKTPPGVLIDPDRKIFGEYQIIALPTLLVVAADRKLKYKAAGFGVEGVGQARVELDTLYGRERPKVAEVPAAAPEVLRHFALARKFLALHMAAQGEKELKAITAAHPEFRPAWVELGYQHIASERAGEAADCLDHALALDKNQADVAAGMAWLAWKKGNQEESKAWAARVPADDPHRQLLEGLR